MSNKENSAMLAQAAAAAVLSSSNTKKARSPIKRQSAFLQSTDSPRSSIAFKVIDFDQEANIQNGALIAPEIAAALQQQPQKKTNSEFTSPRKNSSASKENSSSNISNNTNTNTTSSTSHDNITPSASIATTMVPSSSTASISSDDDDNNENQESTDVVHELVSDFNNVRDKLARQQRLDEADQHAVILFNGAHFMKYGKMGKPKSKFVVCSQDGILFWSDVGGGKTMTSLKVVNISKIFTGKKTSVFQRKIAANVAEELCFSVITNDRSLDLQAESEEVRDAWVKALRYAAENVQNTGKVCRAPPSTTEMERKERTYLSTIQELQAQLDDTKKTIAQKNRELIQREQQLVLERRDSANQLQTKDEQVTVKQQELQQLSQQQTELHHKLKRVHHEREASRAARMNFFQDLESRCTLLEQQLQLQQKQSTEEIERLTQSHDMRLREVEEKHQQEKEQLSKILADSQKVLAKAKDTLHKRQVSRAERIAAVNALQAEVEELRQLNQELREQVAQITGNDIAPAPVRENKSHQAVRVLLGEDADDDHQVGAASRMPIPVSAVSTPRGMSTRDVPQLATPLKTVNLIEALEAAIALSSAEVVSKECWQPDSSSNTCQRCTSSFTLFNRRHHCRKCGHLVCGNCSRGRAKVEETQSKVRVCNSCVTQLQHRPQCPQTPQFM